VCVAIASFISVLTGIVTDYITTGSLSAIIFDNLGQSLAISLSMVSIACAAGVLIGVAAPSVLVGAILVIYGGNQISVIPLLPTLLNIPDAVLLTVVLAVVMTTMLLALAVILFERKQF
jgi:ABC-2 type transport system permease protein